MRKVVIILGLIILSSLAIYANDTIRIMSLNIDRGQETSLENISSFIMKFSPNAVALQEMDMYPNRPYAPNGIGKNFIAEMENYTRMYGIFGLTWKHYFGWDCGNVILSQNSFNKTENFLLPQQGKETRAVIISYFDYNGYNICLASTHLNYENPEIREAQIKYLYQIMEKQEADIIILCGDFNTKNTSEVFSVMEGWRDALPDGENTFSAKAGFYRKMKIDYVLYKSVLPLKIANAIIECDEAITDHCACIVDFEIPDIIMPK